MTADAWTFTTCPQCRKSNSVELGADLRLCLECRHEWAPSSAKYPVPVEAITEDVPPAPALRSVPDHADLPEAPAHITAARSKYLGAVVALPDLGVGGVVTEITGDGWAVVELTPDHELMVLPDEFKVTDAAVVADETIAALATTDMVIAALMLRAGAVTLQPVGDGRRLTLPPDGFLPDEGDVMPVVEHGAAYAIAILALVWGITNDDLLALAESLDEAADAAKGAP